VSIRAEVWVVAFRLVILGVLGALAPLFLFGAISTLDGPLILFVVGWIGGVGYLWYETVCRFAYRVTLANGTLTTRMIGRTKLVPAADVATVRRRWSNEGYTYAFKDGHGSTIVVTGPADQWDEFSARLTAANPEIRVEYARLFG
jgi:hypothetical protein